MDKGKMNVMSVTFKFLTLCGCWQPKSWSSPIKLILYNAYTVFIIILVHTATISQLMDAILYVETAEDFTDNSYMMLAMVIACCKMTSLLVNRRNIAYLSEILEQEPFKPDEEEEINIQNKFERMIRSNTLGYATLLATTDTCIAITSFFMDFRKHRLTFRAWIPFDYSSSLVFPFVFVYQVVGLIAGASFHVASDVLFCGLLMQICCQFEILESRLKKITNDNDGKLSSCIRHHDQIYQYACTINDTFRIMICIQFFVSTLVVCFNLCQLVKIKTLSAKILQMVSYMCCILIQIFLYCWYGNEVKLKSLQVGSAIFATNWTPLSTDVKRNLVMIMRRATVPIEFTSAHIITMNLESFVNLLKTSYTAYNLLQQTQ